MHKMIKTLFLDIDGTLLSFETHRIPLSAVRAIEQAQAKGVKVIISTGRALPLVRLVEGIKPDGYITNNGCACYTADFREIYKAPIPDADLHAITEYVRDTGFAMAYCQEHRIIVNRSNDIVEEISQLLELPDFPIVDEAEVFSADVTEIIAYITEEEEIKFRELMPSCDFPRWHPLFTDIVRKGHSKQTGIDRMIEHFGCRLDETMAVGDGGNDVEMLRHVAIGVAMGNATDEVKAHADHVTTHVDEDGLANAIDKFILSV